MTLSLFWLRLDGIKQNKIFVRLRKKYILCTLSSDGFGWQQRHGVELAPCMERPCGLERARHYPFLQVPTPQGRDSHHACVCQYTYPRNITLHRDSYRCSVTLLHWIKFDSFSHFRPNLHVRNMFLVLWLQMGYQRATIYQFTLTLCSFWTITPTASERWITTVLAKTRYAGWWDRSAVGVRLLRQF